MDEQKLALMKSITYDDRNMRILATGSIDPVYFSVSKIKKVDDYFFCIVYREASHPVLGDGDQVQEDEAKKMLYKGIISCIRSLYGNMYSWTKYVAISYFEDMIKISKVDKMIYEVKIGRPKNDH